MVYSMKRSTQLNILLVDDHAILRKGLKRILEDQSYSIIGEAENAIEALAFVKNQTPDVVILDIGLPGMRGIELADEILNLHPETKIIFLTVHKEEEYVTQALAVGASGYVLKDCLDTEIINAIECIAHGKTYLTPMISDEISNAYVHASNQTNVQSPFENLSCREREVLTLICDGDSNKEIAELMCISARTVEHHRESVMKKLGAGSVAELIKLSIKKKLIEL